MRCKMCEYRLWNLDSRRCPECGAAFYPSDYEFVINSVQFCCPHCDQGYYGTGPNGHLEPMRFNCVACGRQIHMDQMVLRPTAELAEEQTEGDRNPWLDRRRDGAIKGWFAMIGRAMVGPGRLILATSERSSVGQALWFSVVTIFLFAFCAGFPMLLFQLVVVGLVGSQFGGGGGDMPSATIAGMAVGIAGGMLGAVVATLVGILLWGLVTHGLLLLGGRPVHGLGRTYQALCYSCGANVLSAVPCLGFYLSISGWTWWFVSAILMLKEGQRVHGGRAVFAVLTLPVLLFLLVVGSIVSMIVGVSPAIQNLTPVTIDGTSAVTLAVVDYAEQHNGVGPDHAVQLVTGGYLSTYDLVDAPTATTEAEVPVSSTTLEQLEQMSPDQQRAVEQQVLQQLPADVIAHRFGDFVFVNHCIDFNGADPGLWVVIQSAEPSANVAQPPLDPVEVGTVNGTTITFPASILNQELAAQNALRTQSDLPPLPDPSTVTHESPATAP